MPEWLTPSVREQQILQEKRPTDYLENIPSDPDEFYKDFGLIRHPETALPVSNLTAYQRRVWQEGQRYRYLLVVKSHRIGLSTSELLHDFWHAVTDCRGQEILIVSQDLKHAKDHLYTLRKWILSSDKYRHYLLTNNSDSELLMRDEATKVMEMYIRNPDNPFRPTRIIGLGGSAGGLWSWKDVKHIHMSDIAVCPTEYTETIYSALTRLALSGGHIVIETPPAGVGNPIHNLYLKAIEAERNPNTIGRSAEGFRLLQIDATAAVDAGVMTQEWLDDQKAILGSQFDAFYGAKFTAIGGNIFNLEAIEQCMQLGKSLKIDYDNIDLRTHKSMGIDPAYGSSQMAFVIVEQRKDNIVAVIHTSAFNRPSHETMKDHAMYLLKRYNVSKVYVDGSQPAFVRSLKIAIGEEHEGEMVDYETAIAEYKKNGVDPDLLMTVCPVNFSTMHKQMLANLKSLVERPSTFAIDPDQFSVLCNEMLTAQEKDGKLDKTRLSFDLFDALRMACLPFYTKPKYNPANFYVSAIT